MSLQATAATQKGLHLENQDSFLVNEKRGLFAVADGVTLSRNGKKASNEAIQCLKNWKGDIKEFFPAVNKKILDLKTGSTTLTVASIKNNSLSVGHVGDSVLFLVRKSVQKITKDDALPSSNVLTQVIGKSEMKSHFYTIPLQEGDIIILATDGVSKYVTEKEILESIKKPLSQIPGDLIRRAKKRPKLYEDDKTIIVIQVKK